MHENAREFQIKRILKRNYRTRNGKHREINNAINTTGRLTWQALEIGNGISLNQSSFFVYFSYYYFLHFLYLSLFKHKIRFWIESTWYIFSYILLLLSLIQCSQFTLKTGLYWSIHSQHKYRLLCINSQSIYF